MSGTRQARLRVEYNNVDISLHIAPFVISATYVDNAHGKADSLSIVLEDKDDLWKGGWRPAKGATLKAWIDCLEWDGPGHSSTLFCGSFEVDKLGLSVSDSGDRFTISAISAKVQNSLRREKKSCAWENITLKQVLGDIADKAGMGIIFDAGDIPLGRVEQNGESDLAFLKRISDKHGLNLKVAESTLVVYEGAKFDSRPPVLTLRRGSSAISSVRLDDGVSEVYRACMVSYHDPATKEDLEYTFKPEGAPATGQTLKINKRVESLAGAMKLAQDELRKKNKDECTGSISMMGDPRLRGACVVALEGYRTFDGNLFIETATHSIDGDGGYSTENNVRRTLGY